MERADRDMLPRRCQDQSTSPIDNRSSLPWMVDLQRFYYTSSGILSSYDDFQETIQYFRKQEANGNETRALIGDKEAEGEQCHDSHSSSYDSDYSEDFESTEWDISTDSQSIEEEIEIEQSVDVVLEPNPPTIRRQQAGIIPRRKWRHTTMTT